MAHYPQSRSLLLWVPQFMIFIAFFPSGRCADKWKWAEP
jgi:hypothetical protein